MTEYYHTLLEKGGRLLKDGEVVHETDYQILASLLRRKGQFMDEPG